MFISSEKPLLNDVFWKKNRRGPVLRPAGARARGPGRLWKAFGQLQGAREQNEVDGQRAAGAARAARSQSEVGGQRAAGAARAARSRRPADAPKMPPSAFALFVRSIRSQHPVSSLFRAASQRWAVMPMEEKTPFLEEAAEKANAYRAAVQARQQI